MIVLDTEVEQMLNAAIGAVIDPVPSCVSSATVRRIQIGKLTELINARVKEAIEEYKKSQAVLAASATQSGVSQPTGENWWNAEALEVIRHARTNEPHDNWVDWQSAIAGGLLRAFNRGQDSLGQPALAWEQAREQLTNLSKEMHARSEYAKDSVRHVTGSVSSELEIFANKVDAIRSLAPPAKWTARTCWYGSNTVCPYSAEGNKAVIARAPEARPLVCTKHNEPMVVVFYDRPGSPPGNGWGCKSCIAERASHPAESET